MSTYRDDMTLKISLHDGTRPVKSISIMGLFKDNVDYLEWLFPRLESMEAMYDVRFRYYFYTNNNTDDTAAKLEGFVRARGADAGRVMSEMLAAPTYTPTEFKYARVKFLADLRSKHLRSMREAGELTSDWTIIMDSQVYFEPDILIRLMSTEPRSKEDSPIAMLTCNTKEIRRNPEFNPSHPDPRYRQPFISHNHYYDSYALVELDGRMFYPVCRFPECTTCVTRCQQNGIAKYTDDLVNVRSAFAGFVMMPTRYLQPDYVEWKTTEMRWGELALCEHIYFCDMVRIASGGERIVIVRGVDDVTWIK